MLESSIINFGILFVALAGTIGYVFWLVFAPINMERAEPTSKTPLFMLMGGMLLILPISDGLGLWQVVGQVLRGQAISSFLPNEITLSGCDQALRAGSLALGLLAFGIMFVTMQRSKSYWFVICLGLVGFIGVFAADFAILASYVSGVDIGFETICNGR